MSKNNAIIERMILDVGGNKIELTTEQAKNLHSALAEIFGSKPATFRYEGLTWRWQKYEWANSGASAKFDPNSGTLSCAV